MHRYHQQGKSSKQKNRMVQEMIKELTRTDAWNRMRNLMVDHMEEVDWEKHVEAHMKSVVCKSDIDKQPYVDMLKDLGGHDLVEKLRTEADQTKLNDIDYLVEQLVKIKPFAMDENMKTRLFKLLKISYEDELNEAYNSAREKVRLNPAMGNQL